MHTRTNHPTNPQQLDGRARWYLINSLAVVLILVLPVVFPPCAHAKVFQCGAGDVNCLITAIETANANGQTNTIRLAAGTYALTAAYNGTPHGLPVITSTLTIQGAGAETTIIKRDAPFDLLFFFGLLQVAATGSLTLEGLTLREGLAMDGGGIYNAGTLTLTDCILMANQAFHASGGGIYNAGTATLINSTLTANGSYFGGGIYNAGTLTLTNSTLIANRARHGGAGISNAGTLTLTNSTLTANVAEIGYANSGGGINNAGTLTLTNSTLTANVAFNGGGIANGGTLRLTNCTLTDNDATIGGGIASSNGSATLQNTILALNTASYTPTPSPPDDCYGVVNSLGNNLIGNPTSCTITKPPGVSDLTGNPGLDTFTDDGTPGNGHFPLLPGSSAIDAGNDAGCPKQDQLGQPRVNIPGVGTNRCDIGAIEFQKPDAALATTAQATP